MLSDLLAKATNLSVEEVKAGIAVKTDHVYVIPPNAFMTIGDGVFSLTPEPRGLDSISLSTISCAPWRKAGETGRSV